MKYLLIFIFSVLSLNIAFSQKKLSVDKAKSNVIYAMKHPMHDWTGTNKDVNAVLIYDAASKTVKQVAAVLKVSGFDSGNSNRDSHMIEVLEAIKFPTINFSSSNLVINGEKFTAKGNLTFHGITKSIEINGTLKDTGKKVEINSDFSILLTDYQVTKPTLLGVACENELKLKLNISFNQ